MSVRARFALCAVLAPLFAACRGSSDYALQDTEGRSYRVRCEPARCSRELESPEQAVAPPGCASGRAHWVLAGRPVPSACPACRGAVEYAPGCRALRCQRSNDCPPAAEYGSLECVRGLCQYSDHTRWSPVSVTALCMAGAGRWGRHDARESLDREAIARASCPSDGACAPSASCRQP